MVGEITFVGPKPGKNYTGEPLSAQRPGTGRRLAKFMGLEPAVFDQRFRRMNLLDTDRPLGLAERTAMGRRAAELMAQGGRFVLLGQDVARAFRLPNAPILCWLQLDVGCHVAVLPHPSGRDRWYNDVGNVARTMTFMRELSELGFRDFRGRRLAGGQVAFGGVPVRA